MPWFKCISTTSSKSRICATIQSILVEIVEEDVDAIIEDETDGGDVSITNEAARVTTWKDHSRVTTWKDHSSRDSSVSFPDEIVYPEIVSSLKYKQLWRGLEVSRSKTSVEAFLAKYKEILGEAVVTDSDNCFENCLISFNMASNLVYIGSNDKDVLQSAVAKLHAAVELHVSCL